MAKVKYLAPRTGLRTIKYKTGASGGGFGTNPAGWASGTCLTYTANDEVGIAGADDPVECFLDTVDETKGTARVYTPNVGEIADCIANGTIAVGDSIVGYSDTDRGKAKSAVPTYSTPATPTVQELKTAVELSQAARWVVKSSSAGKISVTPRA